MNTRFGSIAARKSAASLLAWLACAVALGLIGCAGGTAAGDDASSSDVDKADTAASSDASNEDVAADTTVDAPDDAADDAADDAPDDAADDAADDATDTATDAANDDADAPIDCATLDCDDDNPCTSDDCAAGVGCVHAVLSDSAATPLPCDDGDTCSTGDRCLNGACLPTAVTSCDDADPCTSDTCEAGAKGCSHIKLTATAATPAPCTDGDACTIGDACDQGVCLPGAATSCDDANPCTNDSCLPAIGCAHEATPAACDDGDTCTFGDNCKDGVCLPEGATNCDDNNPCTDESCGQDKGCSSIFNTKACDDGDVCTGADTCDQGLCKGSAAASSGKGPCDDGNPCTTDSCDAATGCSHVAATSAGGEPLPCDDGNACTIGDVCNGTACDPGTPKSCNDGNACTHDVCDLATGCTNSAADGLGCEDGSACTLGDSCKGGLCIAAKPKLCDDGDPCTIDSCDAKTAACSQSPNTGSCDDGDACTEQDTCVAGSCKGAPLGGGATANCDDSNACTVDVCDAATGCKHVNTAATCDDGDACTKGDTCKAGACKGAPISCDDGEDCTLDTCDSTKGCSQSVLADGEACATGDPCQASATCNNGVCVAAVASELTVRAVPLADLQTDLVTLGDLDGDGKLDVVVVETKAAGNGEALAYPQVRWLRGKGDGSFEPAKVLAAADATPNLCLPASGGRWAVALHDVDGDTKLDVVVGGRSWRDCDDPTAKQGSAMALVFANKGGGTLAKAAAVAPAPLPAGLTSTQIEGIAFADLDGDSASELVVIDRQRKSAGGSVFQLMTATPTLVGGVVSWPTASQISASASTIVTPPNGKDADSGFKIQVADLNHDTLSDLLIAPDDAEYFSAGALALLQSKSTKLTFTTTKVAAIGSGAFGPIAMLGDVDGDGQADLVGQPLSDAADALSYAEPLVWVSKTADATWFADASAKRNVLAPATTASNLTAQIIVAIGDYDGDGRLDVLGYAIKGKDDLVMALWLQTHAGVWTRLDSFAIDDAAARLPSADFDGDGRPEIVLADAKQKRILLISVDTSSCVDGEVCTTDSCNKGAGCQHAAKLGLCDDGDPCMSGDTCVKGSCSDGPTPLDCDDGNGCTTDACDAKKGCTHTGVANGTACSDGNACTLNDTCSEASCAAGSGLSCDDNDVCTDDGCDPSVGCLHQDNAGNCNDGDACTDSDACNGGACLGAPVDCNDGDGCTTDACDAKLGCTKTPNSDPCNDGNACTEDDVCAGGVCAAGKAKSCDDSNVCSFDTCDAQLGCVHTAAIGADVTMNFEPPALVIVNNKLAHAQNSFVLYEGSAGNINVGVYPVGGGNSAKPSGDFDAGYFLLKRTDGTPFSLRQFTMVVQAGITPTGPFTVIGTQADGTKITESVAAAVASGTSMVHKTPTLKNVVGVQFGVAAPYTQGYGANVIRVDDIVTSGNAPTCDDGDACTTDDACVLTSCKGTPKVCAAGTTCSTASATAGQCLGTCTSTLELASGGMPTFVIRSGTLWAWGPNADYRLGLDDVTPRNNEVQVGAASDWAMVSASGDHTAAIKTDGTLWTWGKGTSGALGHGDTATKKVPTQVGVAKDWAVVSTGNVHTAAVKTDGTLWVWGQNTNGQLCGAGGGVVPTPTQIGQGKSWKFDNRDSISAIFSNTMAIASDGSIWGCGQNEAGSLAVGHTSQVNTLTREATSSTGFVRIFAHRLVSIAIKGDGSLWTAGQAQYPRLARSCSGIGCIVFGQEATLAKDWKLAALGGFHVNALKTDGTLWSVGNDEGGVLWLGYVQTNSNWVKSPGTGFIDIGANYYGAYGLKSDGSHWASGGNGDGALGIGTAAASVFSDGKTTGSAPAPTVKCLK